MRLCLHILPDVLWHDRSRFLVGPRSVVLAGVRFFYAPILQAQLERKPRKGEAPAFLLPFSGLEEKNSSFFETGVKRKLQAMHKNGGHGGPRKIWKGIG